MKAHFRKGMMRQHRAAMERDGTCKGVVTFAEIAALLEQAAVQSWRPDQAVAMHEAVGYYVDPATGLMQWDLTRRLTPVEVAAAGDVGAARQRQSKREAIDEQRAKQVDAMEAAKLQVAASTGAIAKVRAAPVERPSEPVPRATKRSLNKHGVYVTGQTHQDQRAASKAEAKEAVEQAEVRGQELWNAKGRREAVTKAEAALEEDDGSVDKLARRVGAVGLLGALVWSRTGHGPKKKNNTPAGATESELVTEVKRACFMEKFSLMPKEAAVRHVAAAVLVPAVAGPVVVEGEEEAGAVQEMEDTLEEGERGEGAIAGVMEDEE